MLHTHKFMITAILASFTLGACATDQDRGREVEITAQDVAKLPAGQDLTVDLRGDTTYLINVSQPADQSRIVLERSNGSVNLRDYLNETGLMSSSTMNLTEIDDGGSCSSGWELQCAGSRCCTVCQDTGAIGGCN